MTPEDERRTWNTPLRKPWNPVIKACLNAIDEHVALYLQSDDPLHLTQAETLRAYVTELKEWIYKEEGKIRKGS